MEITKVKPSQASMQLAKPSPSFSVEKLMVITGLLAKLGVRRQAKLAAEDYLVLGEDLLKFNLEDITGGLDDIAKSPRREGETAFPELARLKQAIVERKLVREAAEIRKDEQDAWEAHKAMCEQERAEWILAGKPLTEQEQRLDALLKKAANDEPRHSATTLEEVREAIERAKARRASADLRPAPEVPKAEELTHA